MRTIYDTLPLTIGVSTFTKHEDDYHCGVGIRPHAKAKINEHRSDHRTTGHYCVPHALQAMEDARARANRS